MGIFTFFSSLFSGKGKQGKAPRRKHPGSVPSELDIQVKPGGAKPARKPRTEPPVNQRPASAGSAETALGFKVAGGRPDGKPERRRSFRVTFEGLVCRINELQAVVRVRDISATGLALLFKGRRIKAGAHLHLALGLDGKALIKGLVLRVVRHEEGVLAGEFEELDRAHEDRLNQIVLEAQKRLAERKAKTAARSSVRNG